MVVDQTLQFAARRNVPVRYNRDHVAATLKAMQRVAEVRAKREKVFYKNRMAQNKEKQKLADKKLVVENEHLLPRVRASETIAEKVAEPMIEDLKQDSPRQRLVGKQKIKQRLLVGGGIMNEMDLD